MKRTYKYSLIAVCCLLLIPANVMARSSQRQAGNPALVPQSGGNQLTLPIDSMASGDFVSSHFLGSSYCVRCHDNLLGEEVTVSLVEDWRVSMMAFSFIDPLWQAKVRSEILRVPKYAEVIEEKCVRCHAPMASAEAAFDGAAISIFDDGFASQDNPYHDLALQGVSCTLCHQIKANNLGSDDSFSGGFEIGNDTSRNRPLYAQVPDPFTNSMQRSVNYRPAYGAHLQDSSVCATCHELLTPYIDLATNDWASDKFPEQTPYSEWLESLYSDTETGLGKTCHDCHLTHEEYVPAAKSPNWLEPLADFSRHTFYTENLSMLEILDAFAQELSIDGSGINEAAAESAAYLAAAGTLEEIHTELKGGQLEVTLKVHNHTGHKLPTSIPIRRVYLHFLVTDLSGKPVFESGRILPDGSIVGVDADADLASFEPHYETIVSDKGMSIDCDQVQVYEGIMGNTEGDLTYTLLHAAQFLKDNRLLPDGFDKSAAALRVQVFGDAYDDMNFTGGGDTITYQIKNLAGPGYNVLVELRDQTMAYPFLKDLFKDSGDEVIADFERMYLDPAIKKDSEVIDALKITVARP